AAWLYFERERFHFSRGFRRRRSARKRTIKPRGQLERAIAGVDPFGGTDSDAGRFKTYRVVRPRLSCESKGQRHAPQLRETAFLDLGPGRSPGEFRNAREQSWRYRSTGGDRDSRRIYAHRCAGKNYGATAQRQRGSDF